ncbi:MAG: helix-turn-helix domain-containing protein, partial [Candidatus Sumerlaeia bacterium]
SPMDYLLRLRIDKARQLLMQTSMNLAEIAEHTGFSSPYHLSNVFKKVRGQSPSEYRRSV